MNLQDYLLIEELNDALNDEWINKESLEMLGPYEKRFANEMKITYQPGKGVNYLVSILIPKHTLPPALRLLKCDETGISPAISLLCDKAHVVQK